MDFDWYCKPKSVTKFRFLTLEFDTDLVFPAGDFDGVRLSVAQHCTQECTSIRNTSADRGTMKERVISIRKNSLHMSMRYHYIPQDDSNLGTTSVAVRLHPAVGCESVKSLVNASLSSSRRERDVEAVLALKETI